MSFLTLKDIGKIYVSDSNVVVGIRSVNLSFDKGEFVAITGKSGSGKSTLLNILSGMDSYEEGELYIEDNPTSHYIESDWEEYRQQYISFIFQNYNIIDSFTVLENVELSLMHIVDKRERRKKALELIDKVGLSSHINHKGSKLSGGQKQRTVIARALAKDSPIILADEPTGNLDSATSKEIINLLHEISKDKLLIIVTHNFEEVENVATRHIRVHDGGIEFDHSIKQSVSSNTKNISNICSVNKKQNLENGFNLGFSIFKSKPKLSIFLSLLLLIGTIGIFLITSLCGRGFSIFNKNYMFNPIEGRVVLSKSDGSVFTDEELSNIVEKYNAANYLHYDILLDENRANTSYYFNGNSWRVLGNLEYNYNKNYGNKIIGSYPINKNEVFLYLPIHTQPEFGKNEIVIDKIIINNLEYKISGIKYYYDNTLYPQAIFTKEGYDYVTASYFLVYGNVSIDVTSFENNKSYNLNKNTFISSFEIEENKIYIDDISFLDYIDSPNTSISISSRYVEYNYHIYKEREYVFETTLNSTNIQKENPNIIDKNTYFPKDATILIHPDIILDMAKEALETTYSQASIFFDNFYDAEAAVKSLKDDGYTAIIANTTYQFNAEDAILNVLANLAILFVWFMAILFIAFFVNLCSFRSLNAFKEDIAIMRSMGIPTKVITIGVYTRMMISLIPSFIIMFSLSSLIFMTPSLNSYLTYLHFKEYLLIIIGMILLTLRVTHKQIHKLFNETVKKSLKGGN